MTVQGSGQLAIDLPTHADLGPVQIESLRLAIAPADDQIGIDAGAVLAVKLGPVRAVVENIGVHAAVKFQPGNLGPIDIDMSFKPPVGVGLSIQGGAVTGGGFLSFDTAQGQYAGALQLSVSGLFTLSAIGLITTRMPDGTPGFSLLVVITAEFSQGIQLGFGFTLLGVGGLLGLNRSIRLQALLDGVRSGAIDAVMFPKDVLANAPRIISDLKRFFRRAPARSSSGRWRRSDGARHRSIRIVLGIIIEIPGNIAAIGVVRVAIPNAEAPLILLQVSFAGALEFDKKRFFFFAALFESRIGVPDDRRGAGPAARVRERRQLRPDGRRVPPAICPAAAAVPESAPDQHAALQRRGGACQRGLLRGDHVEHGAVRRAAGAVLRIQVAVRPGPPVASTRSSGSHRSTSPSTSPPRSR